MVDIIVTPPPSTTVSVGNVITPSTPAPKVDVYTGQPGPRGVPGPQGAQGIQGPPGETPVIAYTHIQNAVSSTWTINHNLGFNPNVTTLDSAGTTIEGSITFVDANNLTISFSVGLTGKAYLS